MAAIKTTAHRGYDVIGDIHGCAHTLERLLEQMGYRKRNGIYQHPSRQAIFIGDIIDRGPRIREALHLVRDMVEHGFARIVMGNHEYNALGYCTRARPGSGKKFLREHNARHDRLIKETLEQFDAYPHEWNEFLEWFYSIPLFIDEDGFRVVHACWDQTLIDQFRQSQGGACIDEDFLHASAAIESFAGQVMDIGIVGDRIVAMGDLSDEAVREIDASGRIVTPGFVDIHTHYDGQATWDPEMAPSSWHGVTTVVMGNCGVGFAPAAPDRQE